VGIDVIEVDEGVLEIEGVSEVPGLGWTGVKDKVSLSVGGRLV